MIDIQLGKEIAKKIMNDTFGDIKMRTPIDTTTRFSTEPLEIERTKIIIIDTTQFKRGDKFKGRIIVDIVCNKLNTFYDGKPQYSCMVETVEETKMLDKIKLDDRLKRQLEMIKKPNILLQKSAKDLINKLHGYKGETMNKILIPEYVGYKGKTITLVWSDDTTTKATYKEDGTQDLSFLYGFLIAYYKKVHYNLDSKQLQAKLNYSIYEKDMEYQLGYLMSVFEENCGLSHKKQQQFIGNYVLILAPFEIDPLDLKRTYKVDEKFLPKKPKYLIPPF
jgi:hypothetical protein